MVTDKGCQNLHDRSVVSFRVTSNALQTVDPSEANSEFVAAQLVGSLCEAIRDLALLVDTQRSIGKHEAGK